MLSFSSSRILVISAVLFLVTCGMCQAQFWQLTSAPGPGIFNSLAAGSTGILYAGTDNAVLRSTDHGAVWDTVFTQSSSQYFQALCTTPDGFVFAGCYNSPNGAAVLRSSDRGSVWTTTFLPGNLLVSSISVSPVTRHVFAATGTAGLLYRSTDGGINFDSLGNFGGMFGMVPNVAYASDGSLIANSYQFLFRSTDDGDHWTKVDSIASGDNAYSLTADRHGNVAAGTQLGFVYRSTDNGISWISSSAGIPYLTSLVMDGAMTFAGSRGMAGRGVARTIDGGANWTLVNGGLTDTTITSLAMDSSGFLYAAAHTGFVDSVALFRSTGPVTSVQSTDLNHPDVVSLEQNYPNPFNPATAIGYFLPAAGDVRMTVANVLGQIVYTTDLRSQSPGRHSIHFDGSSLASGIYFYLLKAKLYGSLSGYYSESRKMILLK